MTAGQKPDAALIHEEWTHFERMWNGFVADCSVIDSWYRQTARIWWDPQTKTFLNRPEIIPPTATNIVDHLTTALAAFEFAPHREPVGRGQSNEQKADEIEPWVTHVFQKASLLEPSLTFVQAGKHAIQYGRGIIQGPMWDTSGKPLAPEKAKGESDREYSDRVKAYEKTVLRDWFPLRIKAPHPARVFCDPYDKQPRLVLMRYRMYAYQLEELTQTKKAQQDAGGPKDVRLYTREDDAKAYDLVTVTERWTERWHALIADKKQANNAPEFVEANPYGFVPFVQFYSGLGGETADMEEVDPKYFAKSFLTPIIPLLHADAQRLSAEHNAIVTAGFPQEIAKEPSIAAQAGPDKILPGTKDDYGWKEIPNYPNYLFQIGAEHVRRINESVPAFTLIGQRQEGVSTVGQQTILTAAAEQILGPLRQQIGQAAAIVGSNTLKMVDINGQAVTVNGVTVGPDQIKGDYNLTMNVKETNPLLLVQKFERAMALYSAGLYSMELVWRDIGEEDATGVRVSLLKDLLYKQPRMVSEGLAAIARAEGHADMAEEFEQVVKALDAQIQQGAAQAVGNMEGGQQQAALAGPALPGSMEAAQQAGNGIATAFSGNGRNGTPKLLEGM